MVTLSVADKMLCGHLRPMAPTLMPTRSAPSYFVPRFDLSHSHALQAFDDATNNLGRGDAAAGNVAAQGGNEDDDDVVMGGGNQELLNNRCPITQRNVS